MSTQGTDTTDMRAVRLSTPVRQEHVTPQRYDWHRGTTGTPSHHRDHPPIDRLQKVSLQIVTMPVPAQEGITRDNVTVRVDAMIYFRVQDAARAVVNVEDYQFTMGQVAQTSLRSIIGKSDLDDLLSHRERSTRAPPEGSGTAHGRPVPGPRRAPGAHFAT